MHCLAASPSSYAKSELRLGTMTRGTIQLGPIGDEKWLSTSLSIQRLATMQQSIIDARPKYSMHWL